MDTGKRQHLQDIYATDHKKSDDYTPQVSNEIIEERKRDLRRHQFNNFLVGITILVLALTLIFVITQRFMQNLKESNAPTPIAREYIPRHSLPAEEQWVLDLGRSFGDPTWDGEGERPFNVFWLKKAAFNIIMAEKALELARADESAYGQAAKYYEQALEIVPDLEGVKVRLGMIYFQQEEFDKALAMLEDAPESELTFDILNNLGAACMSAGAYDRAEEYLKRSLELKPSYAEALKNLALLNKQADRPDDAVRNFEQYLDQRPQDNETRYDFALYLTKISRWQLAAEQLRRLSKDMTDDHVVYFLLARTESKLGNSDAAISALRRGLQLVDPKLAIAWMDDSEFDQLRNTEDFQALMKYAQQNSD